MGGDDKAATPRLLERVFQFVQTIRRVDVDQDHADFTGGELGDAPLSTIRRPDANALSFLEAQLYESFRALIDLGLQFVVRQTNALLARDQSWMVGILFNGLIEHIADGEAQQWSITGAAGVAP